MQNNNEDPDDKKLQKGVAHDAVQYNPLDDMLDPTFVPKFLRPDYKPEAEEYPGYNPDPDEPPDMGAYDESFDIDPEPNKPLKPRHREIARLHAMGKTNNEICRRLGFSQSRVSILLQQKPIRDEVSRFREKLYEQDLATALKDLGPAAMEVIEETLRSPNVKLREKQDMAKWVTEKLTGKPKQEVSVESNTLTAFMDILKQVQDSGKSLDELDITPSQDPALPEIEGKVENDTTASRFARFVDEEI